MPERTPNKNRITRTATAGLVFCCAAVWFFGSDLLPTALSQARRATKPKAPVQRTVKYSEFPHDVKAHKLECSNCHKFPSPNWNKVRPEASAFPDITEYPKHESCLDCHRQQFFRGTPPRVCTICHVNPGPRDSRRHPYPNPREIFDQSPKGKTAVSDFVVGFPHVKHVDIVSFNRGEPTSFINAAFVRPDRRRAAEESCAVCHQTLNPQGDSKEEYYTPPPPKLGDAFWLKKGTFKTKPIGHTVCFTCHSLDSGISPTPNDCGTCHKLKPPHPPADFDPKLAATMKVTDKITLSTWRLRSSSGTFRHEWQSHADASCSTCHDVAKLDTANPLTQKVPISACAMCHATPTADDGGALNFEMESRKTNPAFQCVKCHITFGKQPIPASHVSALSEATGK